MVTYADKPWLKNYHKGVPALVDIPELSLPEMLDRTVARFPDNTAIYFMGRKITFKELKDHADRFATALAELGIKKGDVVAIHLPNLPQFVIAFYGALRVGATATAVSAILTPPEVRFQLNDSGAKAILTMDGKPLETVNSVRNETKLKHVIVAALMDYLPGKPRRPVEKDGTRQMLNLITDHSPNPPKVKINPREDVAALQYTGGTTGTPKGAMLTHYNFVASAFQGHAWFAWSFEEGKETCMVSVPFFHIYGVSCCMNLSIIKGFCMAVNADPRDFQSLLSLIKSAKPTFFPAVPTIYMRLLQTKGVEKYYDDLKSIKLCLSGAAPLPPEVLKQFEKATGGTMLEGFGLTECSPITHVNPSKEKRKVGSIGLPISSTDCRIADIETGTKLMPVGEAGELAIKGPQVMKGYWNKPEETKDQLRDAIEGEPGPWVLTGDIARMDEEGYFYIVDRKKDMIDVSGLKVYPREVEDVLYEHPAIAMVATVGIPNPKIAGSELVKAFVVLKPGVPENEETRKSIIEFTKSRLAPYKIPKDIEFKKEVPTSLVGKVLRRPLREEERRKANKT